jgi:hypothetical protein
MWQCLRTFSDWTDYQLRFNKTLGDDTALRPRWGAGPQTYPCLVAAMVDHSPRVDGPDNGFVRCAFVYPADAQALLALTVPPAQQQAVRGDPLRQQAAPAGPTQFQFNRWITAEVMAIIHFLVATGICKEEQFEAQLLEQLDRFDRLRQTPGGPAPPLAHVPHN